jgi:N,N'-diacetyllegionaminate synthase
VNIAQSDRVEQLRRFRLAPEIFAEMAELAAGRGVLFIATPFDPDSLKQVQCFVSAVKIASGDLDYVQLLSAAARTAKPVILSTGMGTFEEIQLAIDTVARHLPPKKSLIESLALLHCVSAYPTPPAEANLRAIGTLRETFGLVTGYSDHTLGVEAGLVAACLGARIIEKHFTLDRTRRTFRDHALSADPDQMRQLTAAVHALDKMLGHGDKQPMSCERDNRIAARRSVVAARDLPAGARLTADDLDCVRPATGLPPAKAATLVGREIGAALSRHEPISESYLG